MTLALGLGATLGTLRRKSTFTGLPACRFAGKTLNPIKPNAPISRVTTLGAVSCISCKI